MLVSGLEHKAKHAYFRNRCRMNERRCYCTGLATVIGIKYESPEKGDGGNPTLKVKSFVSDEYKELIELAARFWDNSLYCQVSSRISFNELTIPFMFVVYCLWTSSRDICCEFLLLSWRTLISALRHLLPKDMVLLIRTYFNLIGLLLNKSSLIKKIVVKASRSFYRALSLEY